MLDRRGLLELFGKAGVASAIPVSAVADTAQCKHQWVATWADEEIPSWGGKWPEPRCVHCGLEPWRGKDYQ